MTSVDLQKIGCFVAVADELHFGRAARRLYVTPSAVSVAVRQLENQFGLALFERTSRRVELTAAGQALLPEARDLLARHRSMQEAVRRERSRQRDCAAFTIGLPDEGAPAMNETFRLTAFRNGDPCRAAGEPIGTMLELLQLVAAGEGVITVSTANERFFPYPGVTYRRVPDAPDVTVSLITRHGDDRPDTRAVVDTATQTVRSLIAFVPGAALPSEPLDERGPASSPSA